MKKKLKALLVSTFALAIPLTTTAINHEVSALVDDYVYEDGTIQYGYAIDATEINASCWEFDENGEVSGCLAGLGDTESQKDHNYALRNLAIQGDDSYSVSAKFIPSEESDLSIERTYGIVAWYQDYENYLVYWMQQKTGGDWSGQFYGRIDGLMRKFYVPQNYCDMGNIEYNDFFINAEFEDLWWDQNYSHPSLKGQKAVLLTTSIELKVVSTLKEVTVGGETLTCRSFELHQIVDEIDYTSCEFIIKQINTSASGNLDEFYTGIYSQSFDIGIEDFTITCEKTNFVNNFATKVESLPTTVTSEDDLNTVISVDNAYKGLLSYKANVNSETLTKLENAKNAAVSYVDSEIALLDKSKTTFVEDVDKVVELYELLPEEYQKSITNLDLLTKAIEDADNWVDPSLTPSDTPSEIPSETPSNDTTSESKDNDKTPTTTEKGCKGSVGMSFIPLIMLAGVLTALKKKENN